MSSVKETVGALLANAWRLSTVPVFSTSWLDKTTLDMRHPQVVIRDLSHETRRTTLRGDMRQIAHVEEWDVWVSEPQGLAAHHPLRYSAAERAEELARHLIAICDDWGAGQGTALQIGYDGAEIMTLAITSAGMMTISGSVSGTVYTQDLTAAGVTVGSVATAVAALVGFTAAVRSHQDAEPTVMRGYTEIISPTSYLFHDRLEIGGRIFRGLDYRGLRAQHEPRANPPIHRYILTVSISEYVPRGEL